MRAQGHGRIINCSSVLGLVVMPWREAYNASKFALEGLTHTLRIEMRDTPIDVILIEPGPITTRIRENSIPHFERWINWESSPGGRNMRANCVSGFITSEGRILMSFPRQPLPINSCRRSARKRQNPVIL